MRRESLLWVYYELWYKLDKVCSHTKWLTIVAAENTADHLAVDSAKRSLDFNNLSDVQKRGLASLITKGVNILAPLLPAIIQGFTNCKSLKHD